MKINHINLTVTNVGDAATFLETYFGLQKQFGDDKFSILFDDEGMVLSLTKGGQVHYPRSFHIGFVQESVDKVNEINQRMKDDGIDVKAPTQEHAWTFYVNAPGGFMVEVLA